MKQIFYLILFSIVAVSLQTERKKMHQKSKTQPCDIGSYKVTVKAEKSTTEVVNFGATLNVHYLEAGQNFFAKGWRLDNVDTSKDSLMIFSSSDNANYIPYKHLSEFGYTSLEGQPQTLTAKYQIPDNKGVILLTFSFDFDPAWNTIHETALRKIVDWLSSARDKRLSHVISLKDKAKELASQLFTNKALLSALSQSKSAKEKTLANLSVQKKNLEDRKKELIAQKEKESNDILLKEQELQQKSQALVTVEDQIENENALVESNTKHKSQLEKNLQLHIENKQNYENQLEANKIEINNLKNAVQEECGADNVKLDSAVSTFFESCPKQTNKDARCKSAVETFGNELIQLFPTN